MAPPRSDKAANGSVVESEDESSRTSYTGAFSYSVPHDYENVPLRRHRLNAFVHDPTPSHVQHRYRSGEAASRTQRNNMKSFLDYFDGIMDRRDDDPGLLTMQTPPPLQVFPARRRLPGEQPPLRLADGVSSTQPLRRSRIESRTRTPSASLNGVNPEGPPAEPRPPSRHARPTPNTHLPTFLTSTPGLSPPTDSYDKKAQIPPNFEASKDQQHLQSSAIPKQEHHVANNSMGSTRPAPGAASSQSLGPLCSLPSNQAWMHHPSTNPNELPSVILSNNTSGNHKKACSCQTSNSHPQIFHPSHTKTCAL